MIEKRPKLLRRGGTHPSLSRIYSRILVPFGAAECWLWVGALNNKGYAVCSFASRRWYVHRLLYTLDRGAIGSGLELDHLCRNTNCVNPLHVEPVSHAVNTRRGLRNKCTHGADTARDSLGRCKPCQSAARSRWWKSRTPEMVKSHAERRAARSDNDAYREKARDRMRATRQRREVKP